MPSTVNFNYGLNEEGTIAIDWGSERLRKRAEEHIGSLGKGGVSVSEILYREASSCLGPKDLVDYDIGTVYIRDSPSRGEHGAVRYEVIFFARYSVVFDICQNRTVVEHHAEADTETLVDDVFQLALSEAVWPRGGYILHASSVVLEGKGLVLVGNSGSGKSTTCLSLALNGFGLAGDDASLILPSASGYDLVPMAAEVSVRIDALPLFETSEALSLTSCGDKRFWRGATVPAGNAALRVVAMVQPVGNDVTLIERLSPGEFIAAFSNHPPLHSFHKDHFPSLVKAMHDKGIIFLNAHIGVSPHATADAFAECLTQPHKSRWTAEGHRRVHTVARARNIISEAWAGNMGSGMAEVLPLLVHPVGGIRKASKQILAADPICSLEPLPWDDYDALWAPATESAFNLDCLPVDGLKRGTEYLVKVADPRNIEEWLPEWLTFAPLLYPFLRSAAMATSGEVGKIVDTAWKEYIRRHYPPQLMIYLNDHCQLKCPYCYADKNVKEGGRSLKREDIESLLDWAASQSINVIGLTGGEPTLYPDFIFLVNQLCHRGFFFYFASNFIFAENLRKPVARASTLEIHICDPSDYTAAQRETFESNLGWLASLEVPKVFRYNLYTESPADWDWVASRVKRFEGSAFSFAVPFPSRWRTNRFIDRGLQGDFARVVVDFVDRMKRYGLSPRAAKPYPLCSFAGDEMKSLLAAGALRGTCEVGASGCMRNLLVDPDLNVYPCIGLGISPGSINAFTDLQQIQDKMLPMVLGHLQKVDYSRCRQCALREWKLCMGGCLAYY